MKTWHIYALVDPRTKAVRYVGKSVRLSDRLRHHRNGRNNDDNPHKFRWLDQLKRLGLKPLVVILESGEGEAWVESERKWIMHFRRTEAPLTNLTEGGDGAKGFIISEDSRRKMSEAKKGKPLSLACREAREACRSPLSAEHKDKLSKKLTGQKRSQETCERIRNVRLGTKASESTKLKMSKASKGRIVSLAQIEKLRRIAIDRKFYLHFK